MQRTTLFEKATCRPTIGRNGLSKSLGLVVTLTPFGEVTLEPINSRGEIGRARLVLPQAAALWLAAVLTAMAKE